MAASLSFGLTKLVVPDLPQAERFYCEALGFSLVHRNVAKTHAFQQEQAVLALQDGQASQRLVLVHYLNRPTPPAGAAWIGLIVSDLVQSVSDVEKWGGRVEVPLHRNEAHGVDVAIASDPAGHLIELLQILEPV